MNMEEKYDFTRTSNVQISSMNQLTCIRTDQSCDLSIFLFLSREKLIKKKKQPFFCFFVPNNREENLPFD